MQAFEQQILERLRDQTTAEKGAQKAATDTQKLRKAVAAEEMRSLQVQNDLARIQVILFFKTAQCCSADLVS